jgi:hypothetical protein
MERIEMIEYEEGDREKWKLYLSFHKNGILP